MKILRSVNRRGFNVGTAGWFTVLKPNTWFPASRLPGSFRYLSGQWPGAGEPLRNVPSAHLQILKTDQRQRGLMQPALIVLLATAITAILLWWLMGAPHLR